MTHFNLSLIEEAGTPCYYYDMALLRATLDEIRRFTDGTPMHTHYAIKANPEPEILRLVASYGFGADCVSGNEVRAAIETGFKPESICYAGVGKTDEEIEYSLRVGIGAFNVESIEELEVISEISRKIGIRATVVLRVNPNIDAHTHHYITTGIEENKFGIDLRLLDRAISIATGDEWLDLAGLHFHIGSQITITEPFELLCSKVRELVEKYEEQGIRFRIINFGGGLGIDYDAPDANPIPDFEGYFSTILSNFKATEGQTLHCELGRAIVGQCGSLIAKVIYVKEGTDRRFAILDAGMNNLIRPALYGASHAIQPLTASEGVDLQKYHVVGPVCESADTFATGLELPALQRGDLVAIRSAGAYGAAMSSAYNMRTPASPLFAD